MNFTKTLPIDLSGFSGSKNILRIQLSFHFFTPGIIDLYWNISSQKILNMMIFDNQPNLPCRKMKDTKEMVICGLSTLLC